MADWLVWCPDEGDRQEEARRFRDHDTPEEAAADWAQRRDWDSADYSIVGGRSEPVVLVAPADGSAEPVRLRVTGEAVPHYTARRVEDGA